LLTEPFYRVTAPLVRPYAARFAGLESYSYRSHNAYMAGISLWTLWTSSYLKAQQSP